jgi:hypothetical protein
VWRRLNQGHVQPRSSLWQMAGLENSNPWNSPTLPNCFFCLHFAGSCGAEKTRNKKWDGKRQIINLKKYKSSNQTVE